MLVEFRVVGAKYDVQRILLNSTASSYFMSHDAESSTLVVAPGRYVRVYGSYETVLRRLAQSMGPDKQNRITVRVASGQKEDADAELQVAHIQHITPNLAGAAGCAVPAGCGAHVQMAGFSEPLAVLDSFDSLVERLATGYGAKLSRTQEGGSADAEIRDE